MSDYAFVGEHGGPARGSFSAARPSRYRGFERIVFPREQVATWTVPPRGPASVLLLDASGTYLVAHYDNSVIVLEPYGVRQHIGPEIGRWQALATDKGLVFGPKLHAWTDPKFSRHGSLALFSEGHHIQLCVSLSPERWITAVQNLPNWGEPEIWLESRGCGSEASSDLRWRTRVAGEGIAAIDTRGRTAVAAARMLRVYAVEGRDGRGVVSFEGPLREHTYRLGAGMPESSVAWIVLAASEQGDSVPADRPLRRHWRPHMTLRQRWHTIVDALDSEGAPLWSQTLPFDVLQPAIWGGGERLYFVGRGIAATDEGTLSWHEPSEIPMAASAFGDGSLAVAVGSALWILDTKGKRTQTFEVPGGERIVSQPAIGAEGSVYVATETKIYRLR